MMDNRSVIIAIFLGFLFWSLGIISLMYYLAGVQMSFIAKASKPNRIALDYDQVNTDYKRYQLKLTQQQLITKGMEALANQQHKEGITNLYYAKTIFPYELEPRFYLMYAFMKSCEEKGRYCGNAQKEIQRTYDFIAQNSFKDKEEKRVDCYANWWKRVKGK